MIKQYHLLNDCLAALKGNEHDIGRLQIEIQLYRLKRLLLDDEVAKKIKGDRRNEKDFEVLKERVLQYSKKGRDVTEVIWIISHISAIEKECSR